MEERQQRSAGKWGEGEGETCYRMLQRNFQVNFTQTFADAQRKCEFSALPAAGGGL